MLIHIDNKNSERISAEIFSMYVDKDTNKWGKEKCVICELARIRSDGQVCGFARMHRIHIHRQTQTHTHQHQNLSFFG